MRSEGVRSCKENWLFLGNTRTDNHILVENKNSLGLIRNLDPAVHWIFILAPYWAW